MEPFVPPRNNAHLETDRFAMRQQRLPLRPAMVAPLCVTTALGQALRAARKHPPSAMSSSPRPARPRRPMMLQHPSVTSRLRNCATMRSESIFPTTSASSPVCSHSTAISMSRTNRYRFAASARTRLSASGACASTRTASRRRARTARVRSQKKKAGCSCWLDRGVLEGCSRRCTATPPAGSSRSSRLTAPRPERFAPSWAMAASVRRAPEWTQATRSGHSTTTST